MNHFVIMAYVTDSLIAAQSVGSTTECEELCWHSSPCEAVNVHSTAALGRFVCEQYSSTHHHETDIEKRLGQGQSTILFSKKKTTNIAREDGVTCSGNNPQGCKQLCAGTSTEVNFRGNITVNFPKIAEVRSIVLKNTPWQTDQFKVFKVIVGSFVQVFHRQCWSDPDLDWEDYSVPGVMANQVVIVILETCRGGGKLCPQLNSNGDACRSNKRLKEYKSIKQHCMN
ncbi:hypothetical protein LSH36_338g00013 [Paralvinella palmiformis]|uniref:Uncharacterized protein n=1 Tax=Paralvinella palmiformis TaxID=53620 RepID=A0AAD9JFT7_9ANNE|nr:hypothetical protein LSH36_338g00013 [Paralvinella palmiformis]